MTPPKPPFRLVLTPTQSAAIEESGIRFVTGRPCATDRATLLLFECDESTATAAAHVAMGTPGAVNTNTPAPDHE